MPNQNTHKTHCPQGHAYEGDNVVISRGEAQALRALVVWLDDRAPEGAAHFNPEAD